MDCFFPIDEWDEDAKVGRRLTINLNEIRAAKCRVKDVVLYL